MPQTVRPWLAHYPAEVPAHLQYPAVPLQALLDQAAARCPQQAGTLFYGARLTWHELQQQAQAFARALRRSGLRSGERVALVLANSPQAVVAYYGTLYAGGVVVQLSPLYTERELGTLLADAGARLVVTLDLVLPAVVRAAEAGGAQTVVRTGLDQAMPWHLAMLYRLRQRHARDRHGSPGVPVIDWQRFLAAGTEATPLPAVEPDAIALLQYTGGTTGLAKGCMLTHRNLVANVTQTAAWFHRTRPGRERLLGVLPFFHVYGMTTVMNLAVRLASTMILLPRFEPGTVLRTIQRQRPTLFPGAPTMYVALLRHPQVTRFRLGSIEACISGAAPLPLEVAQRFEALTGGRLVEGYGLTEASPVTHCNPIWGRRKPGSIGLPWPDTDCRLLDAAGREVAEGEVGELWVRGPQVMQGYWRRPEETAAALQDGWLRTGDLASMDDEGYFYIMGRSKELIIVGGFNVYPREIEEVLYTHPDVQEAAVVGAPDEYRGETVVAFIQLKEKAQVDAAALDRYCRERLAAFKVPRRYEFRSELPKSPVGKVLKRILQEQVRGGA